MNRVVFGVALLIGWAAGSAARAQYIPFDAQNSDAISAGVAIEPEPLLLGNAVHTFDSGASRTSFGIGAGFKLAALLLARGDVRVHALLQLIHRPGQHWELGCMLLPFAAHAKNDAARSFGLGLELRCQPSYLLSSYRLGLDLGWQSTLAAHIAHTALARRTFEQRYPAQAASTSEAVDGWYGATAERARLGLCFDAKLGAQWGLRLALGTLFALQHQGLYFAFNMAQFPLYLELAARRAW